MTGQLAAPLRPADELRRLYMVYAGWSLFVAIILLVTAKPLFAAILIPLPLLLRFDALRVLSFFFIAILCFFDPLGGSTVVSFFWLPEVVVVGGVAALILLTNRNKNVRIPFSKTLAIFYLFLLYTFALCIRPLMQKTPDMYLLMDIRKFSYLALLPFFFGRDLFSWRNIHNLLLIIVLSTAGQSILLIVQYATSPARIVSWNEVYFGVCLVLSLVLREVFTRQSIRLCLSVSTVLTAAALLITQTRGVWLGTAGALCIYAVMVVYRKGLANVFRSIVPVALFCMVLFIGASVLFQKNPVDFVSDRLQSREKNEFINPTSSMGYRVYESFMVYKSATLLGHGAGATIYLYQPFMNTKKKTHWWSIHSEYFEMLHKYGWVGLGLFVSWLWLLIVKAAQCALSRRSSVRRAGIAALTSLIVMTLVSITSGYFFRVNTALFTMLLVGIVEYYHPLRKRLTEGQKAIATKVDL
jgi:hypothetical protein